MQQSQNGIRQKRNIRAVHTLPYNIHFKIASKVNLCALCFESELPEKLIQLIKYKCFRSFLDSLKYEILL